MDYDLIITPSLIVYSLGLQWAWQFNIIFITTDIEADSHCDYYTVGNMEKTIKIPTFPFYYDIFFIEGSD